MEGKGQKHTLKDGTEILIRPAMDKDFEESLQFFSDLPDDDRLYLRVDVTDPDVVKKRIAGAASSTENFFRIVALKDEGIIGEAVMEWPAFGWMSHVGEIRSIVGKEYRRKGLASILFRCLFIHAVKIGLEKLEASMLPGQTTARDCLAKLGFTEEGRLPGFVMDNDGKNNDLVVMSVSLEGFDD